MVFCQSFVVMGLGGGKKGVGRMVYRGVQIIVGTKELDLISFHESQVVYNSPLWSSHYKMYIS